MSQNRVYLNVPYAEKDAAKQLGAKWDAKAKRWFIAPELQSDSFAQWLPLPPESIDDTAPPKLTIELVPETCWYTNVRSEVTPKVWEVLKRLTFQKANDQCEICGGKGKRHPVECHEVWDYNDAQHLQTLVRLIALCPACHECKHIGLAYSRGRGEFAARHLARVNHWSIDQTNKYIENCAQLWQTRSQFQWTLDISYLEALIE
jgi:5-methylcytosine-specific restriction endonuclease McrA